MTPDAPKPWPDVLAAYADGELVPADQAEVERRLCTDPTARSELDGQRQLCPENWRLWQGAEPPMPADDTWAPRCGLGGGMSLVVVLGVWLARRRRGPLRRG